MNKAVTAVLVVTSFLGGGSTVYSAFQIQLPSRTSLKVTPDAASIWSWHKEINLPTPGGSGLGTHRERVLVDFDGNGRMDTEDPEVRVTVTDLQVVFLPIPPSTPPAVLRVWLSDGTSRRWFLFAKQQGTAQVDTLNREHALATPLTLRVGTDLFVEFEYGPNFGVPCSVNLIGRKVVL